MSEIIYTAQAGDSLTKIARDQLGDIERWREIAYLNGKQWPYIIQIGEIIKLPGGGDDVEIIDITPEQSTETPVKEAGFSINPVTVILLLAGVFLLTRK